MEDDWEFGRTEQTNRHSKIYRTVCAIPEYIYATLITPIYLGRMLLNSSKKEESEDKDYSFERR